MGMNLNSFDLSRNDPYREPDSGRICLTYGLSHTHCPIPRPATLMLVTDVGNMLCHHHNQRYGVTNTTIAPRPDLDLPIALKMVFEYPLYQR